MPAAPRPSKLTGNRLRAAVERLNDCREQISSYQDRMACARQELDAFDRDPAAWAAKAFPHLSVDSYPVRTRTSRMRKALERNGERISELSAKEADLIADVLDRQKAAIASAAGSRRALTGAWHEPALTLEEWLVRVIERRRENDATAREACEVERMEAAVDSAREEEQNAREQAADDAHMQHLLDDLSPEEREVLGELARHVLDAIAAGRLTAADCIAALQRRAADQANPA